MAPKTATGAELQLDDGPARDSELFLVDGNNLAYRAYYALPEELATSDGFPTNALLGFVNMLFKLLVDYRPKGVAVAWDTRPVHRLEVSQEYKAERKEMPGLLREQFPHFRPIVEAFGYRNLEFEGWEADDVIATVATRADEAGIKTCVVSTDRDAFQLCSENVCLMMTPRGVADVQVYTPERVEARYGLPPEKVPDFIGLKGDTSDNIPGVPGIGDKTAGELIARFGSLEEVLAHVDDLTPARARALREHADQARDSKLLATMRRDLDIDFDPAALVLAPPDRSTLKEIFRRFEFRNVLRRVDELDSALPAAEPRSRQASRCPGRRARPARVERRGRGRGGERAGGDRGGRTADRRDRRPRRARAGAARPGPPRRARERGPALVALAGRRRAGRGHRARGLSRRPQPLRVRPRRPRRRVRDRAPTGAARGARDRGSRPPRRVDARASCRPLLERLETFELTRLYRDVELPLSVVLARHGERRA